ncbi:potassium voltage-gated channel subfamily E member 3 isoform X2 [Excalfactoria chinensis]|uniref:potassium voltage-gated channel subfamily E member 3 isoform X2 n=2 Tax=Excalfactoria chinensis TaxID=46218 RepID=UPI003B3B592F
MLQSQLNPAAVKAARAPGHTVHGADAATPHRLGEEMEEDNRTEPWHRSLQAMLDALNQTLHGAILRPSTPHNTSTRAGRDDNAYLYILFVMTLFAATVGSLILGYTRSRKVDKRSDPYHVYIKNRVSMI